MADTKVEDAALDSVQTTDSSDSLSTRGDAENEYFIANEDAGELLEIASDRAEELVVPDDKYQAAEALRKYLGVNKSFNPIYGDFISSYASSELFFIDGDALVGQALENPFLAWNLEGGAANFGAQFLHAIYLIESCLRDLKERGAYFRIYFFEEMSGVWSGSKLLVRNLIVKHLKGLKSLEVDELPGVVSFDSEVFQDYLDLHKPIFIILKHVWKEVSEVLAKDVEAIQFAFTTGALSRELGVVFSDELSFEGSHAMAFFVAPRKQLLQNISNKAVSVIKQKFATSLSTKRASVSRDDWESLTTLAGNDSRLTLTIAALEKLLQQNTSSTDADLAKIFLFHLSVLPQITLSSRAFHLPNPLPSTTLLQGAPKFLSQLFEEVNNVFDSYYSYLASTKSTPSTSILDFSDARLFCTLILLASEYSASQIDERVVSVWNHLRKTATHLTEFAFPTQSDEDTAACKAAMDKLEEKAASEDFTPVLTPVTCPLVHNLIGPAGQKVTTQFQAEVEGDESTKQYPQWGSKGDFLLDPDALPLRWYDDKKEDSDKKKKMSESELRREKRWQLNQQQKAKRAQKKLTETLLVDTVVTQKKIFEEKESERVTRIAAAKAWLEANDETKKKEPSLDAKKVEAETEEDDEEDEKPTKGKAKAKKAKGKAKAPSKKELIIAQSNKQKEQSKFSDQQSRLDTIVKQLKGDPRLVHHLRTFSKNCKVTSIAAQADMIILRELYKRWKVSKGTKLETLTKEIFCAIQNILRRFYLPGNLEETHLEDLSYLASEIGFDDLAASIEDLKTKTAKAKKKKAKSDKPSKQKITSVQYQLKVVAPNLAREVGAKSDPRVPFIPDEWQLRLLNIVDANESAVICAPTSSGKTFICFYAMEQVLRESSEGVVVYVSPTKALVNQIALEASARFEKDMASGRILVGHMTKEYDNLPRNCQILITIPECLEQLLLSLQDIEWKNKIKYVIFDEVHCIGAEEGYVWEQLLLMSNCPILALSATIANADNFYKWLQRKEQSRKANIHLIIQNERYNDLQPFVYFDEEKSLIPVHPIWALNSKLSAPITKIPDDLKFLPEHCVELVEKLKESLGDKVNHLLPDVYFKTKQHANWNISMKDAARYEKDIKTFFEELLREDQQLAREIMSKMGTKAQQAFDSMASKVFTKENITSELLTLLRKLDKDDMLPAIVFHLDRKGCEFLALSLYHALRREEQKMQVEEGVAAKILRLGKELDSEKKALDRATQDLKEDEKLSQALEDKQEQYFAKLNEYNRLLDIDRRYAFIPKEGAPSKEEIAKYIKATPHEIDKNYLYAALRRGIGVHHPGVPKYYRQGIEILFRLKKLKIIISTSTLALGINMPCKTVVFAQDSFELNSLNYRQMSGRAGRRGFDLRGNIVFFDIAGTKVKRLMNSHLPRLLGNALVSTSLALRLQLRYYIDEKDEGKMEVFYAARRLINLPLFAPRGSDPKYSCHQYRLAIEYLVKEGFLDRDGTANDFAGLASFLSYAQPDNLLFLALFKDGAFETLVTKENDPLGTLLLVLCYIFYRYPIHQTKLKYHDPMTKINLPPLPSYFKASLEKHNQRVLEYATQYAKAYAKTYAETWGEDNKLPLSEQEVAPKKLENETEVTSLLARYAIPHDSRSSFVALSGHGDRYNSSSEFLTTTRSPITFFVGQLPVLELDGQALNSFIMDFFNYQKSLQGNNVPPNVLFESLRSFSLTLFSIANALNRRETGTTAQKVANAFTELFSRSSKERLYKV